MPREAPVTIAVFRRSATSIFLLSNRLTTTKLARFIMLASRLIHRPRKVVPS
jgi:hypothetical protein